MKLFILFWSIMVLLGDLILRLTWKYIGLSEVLVDTKIYVVTQVVVFG